MLQKNGVYHVTLYDGNDAKVALTTSSYDYAHLICTGIASFIQEQRTLYSGTMGVMHPAGDLYVMHTNDPESVNASLFHGPHYGHQSAVVLNLAETTSHPQKTHLPIVSRHPLGYLNNVVAFEVLPVAHQEGYEKGFEVLERRAA